MSGPNLAATTPQNLTGSASQQTPDQINLRTPPPETNAGTPPPCMFISYSHHLYSELITSHPYIAPDALEKNFPGQTVPTPSILPTPTFQEFAMSDKSNPASLAPLNPETEIFDAEIQQISAEDFKRNINAAEQAASHLRNLKLPKSLKDLVDTLATTIIKTKCGKLTNLFSSHHSSHH